MIIKKEKKKIQIKLFKTYLLKLVNMYIYMYALIAWLVKARKHAIQKTMKKLVFWHIFYNILSGCIFYETLKPTFSEFFFHCLI